MPRLSRIIIIASFLHLSPFTPCCSQTIDYLSWDLSRPLVWNDFQGKVPLMASRMAQQAEPGEPYSTANSQLGIGLRFECENGLSRHSAEATFIPAQSWVIAENKTDALLQHEQLHFDIAELFARKLMAQITTLADPCDEAAVQALYESVLDAYDAYQVRYDAETRHGLDKAAQADWERQVSRSLSAD